MKPFWSCWPALRQQIDSAESVLLFLDYDGTLTPLVDHPSKARLSEGVRQLVRKLACQPGVGVALVSGRTLADLSRAVGVRGLCYVGNHGLEMKSPKMHYINPAARRIRPILKRVARDLRTVLEPIQGVWVEDKGLTLTVHYRSAAPDLELLVKNGFHEVVNPYVLKRLVRISVGKQVFEVRPPVRWTKGELIQWLLACWTAATKAARILPIYVGDDETDEDAFESLEKQGVTVVVDPAMPLTKAQYRIGSPTEVEQFLQQLLALRRAKAA